MTREEAIERLENLLSKCWTGAAVVSGEDFKALNTAIASLRAQQEREDPKPLTLDELRQMDGEPVWVVCDVAVEGIDLLSFWALVEVAEESIFLANNLGGRTEYAADVEFEDDGITVYRHKPKEEAT